MKLQDIHIRDPFILLDQGKYYLYGSRGGETWGICHGLDAYVSDDLVEWSSPVEVFTRPDGFWSDRHFWAPEVHKYQDAYYMFVSFKSENACRGTQILKSQSPLGPFVVHSDGPVTPRDWECLDGTLYIDGNGTPHMIFCHEWLQVTDGEMCAMQLSDDLHHAVGEPRILFRASEPAWAIPGAEAYITDGPFLYRTQCGRLLMIWSSAAKDGYCEAIAYSDNGELTGTWRHQSELLFERDGGHGMIFRTAEGELRFIYHQPNNSPDERPHIRRMVEVNGTLCVADIENDY